MGLKNGRGPLMCRRACYLIKQFAPGVCTVSTARLSQVAAGSPAKRKARRPKPACREPDVCVISKPGCVCFHLCVFGLIKFDLPKKKKMDGPMLETAQAVLSGSLRMGLKSGPAIGQQNWNVYPGKCSRYINVKV